MVFIGYCDGSTDHDKALSVQAISAGVHVFHGEPECTQRSWSVCGRFTGSAAAELFSLYMLLVTVQTMKDKARGYCQLFTDSARAYEWVHEGIEPKSKHGLRNLPLIKLCRGLLREIREIDRIEVHFNKIDRSRNKEADNLAKQELRECRQQNFKSTPGLTEEYQELSTALREVEALTRAVQEQ